MSKQNLTVDEEYSGLRLDIFLTNALVDVPSRTFIKQLIDEGRVLVNEKKVKAHTKVHLNDRIEVALPEQAEPQNVQPENIPLDIFYEDEHLVIINKPIGMLVHPVHGCQTGTLVNALLYHFQKLSDVQQSFRPGIVHRLDRETSGLICVAKDNVTHVRLARQFEKHRVKKCYVALVNGTVEHEEGIIDVPLSRHPRHFDKKAVSFDESAREAKTRYRVLKYFDRKATLVALYPESGRTHQLRVHMAHLGHSVLGDDKYGQKRSFPRLALHARSLGFQHPQSKKYIEFSTPIPAEFLQVRA